MRSWFDCHPARRSCKACKRRFKKPTSDCSRCKATNTRSCRHGMARHGTTWHVVWDVGSSWVKRLLDGSWRITETEHRTHGVCLGASGPRIHRSKCFHVIWKTYVFGCGLRLAGGSLMRPLLVFHWMMDESIVTKLMVPKKRQPGINSERRRQYCL